MAKVKCAVCGKAMVEEDDYEECPVCGWCVDRVQEADPDSIAENNISFNEAKRRYAKYGTVSTSKIKEMGIKI